MSVPSLQQAVDRYGVSLTVPSKLRDLHPRKQGNPGNAAALAPAIVLTTISAFEGFVEEFVALVVGHRGQSYGQIAKLVSINNPTVKTFDEKLTQVLGWGTGVAWKSAYTVEVWKPPAIGDSTWIQKQTLNWSDAVDQVEGWMQVRHCLSHGLVAGWRPEYWPGPMRGSIHASSVLRPSAGGKHSLSIHGAESCAHLLVSTARAMANQATTYIGQPALNWSKVPTFAL
ncbi:hypothetical protein [Kribbella sp. VKM Ac-2566]|uniref:hypothetical protein n=1 Tax=Kribbella sp. VKM Ac-2566 TaxID=2512218 RepID=UPI001062D633|nr:hypothetical protein [Kribbella sp. VKM Ac-2566]TDX04033.1 hypothetical protein EV647_2291 [Kribbella sp. VKM Ac-2566]